MLEQFIRATAWEMEPFKPYGAFHLIFTACGLAAVIIVTWLLKNPTEKQHKIVMGSVGGFLVLTEAYKLLFYYYIKPEYNMWGIVSFQMCSIPMYFCIADLFIKNRTVKKGMYNFMVAFNLMGGAMAFIEPSGITHAYWTLTLHACVWHMLLIFVGVYLARSGKAAQSIGEYKYAIVTFVILCAFALTMNFIFYEASSGWMNLFYLGPANSPLIICKDICKNYGWYVNLPAYMFACCVGAFVFYAPFALANRHKIRKAAVAG